MNDKEIQTKLKELRKDSKERKFKQTFDLIINLQHLDLKKPEHKVDVGITLNSQLKAKKLKICAIIDHGIEGAKEIFDEVVFSDELPVIKGNMKKIRELTHKYDRFVVQVNHMPLFAQVLGRYLGPMNKMPSPKLGMIITPKTQIKELYEKLQKTVILQTKKNLVLQTAIGSEVESDEEISKNILSIYDSLIHTLPNHEQNVKNLNVKLTMGKLVEL